MTRLQKKCLNAAAGAHLLVVVAVLCSGFIRPTPKEDNTQLLDVIPANLVDAALNSGVKSAQPPPMATPQPLTPQAQPAPPTPPTPPPPAPKPPTLMERVEKMLTPEKPPVDDPKPADDPTPKPAHKIEVDLTPVVHKVSKSTDDSAAQAAKEQKRLRDQRRKAFADAARSIEQNASSATTVEMPGTSSVSYANYASVVKSIYEKSWIAPDNAVNDSANVRVSVVIGSDGNVISSHILTPSGDSNVDDSVQRTLDRVNFIAPFPDGATEKQRTFIINFNLKAKRMLG
jgi:TonB family protein